MAAAAGGPPPRIRQTYLLYKPAIAALNPNLGQIQQVQRHGKFHRRNNIPGYVEGHVRPALYLTPRNPMALSDSVMAGDFLMVFNEINHVNVADKMFVDAINRIIVKGPNTTAKEFLYKTVCKRSENVQTSMNLIPLIREWNNSLEGFLSTLRDTQAGNGVVDRTRCARVMVEKLGNSQTSAVTTAMTMWSLLHSVIDNPIDVTQLLSYHGLVSGTSATDRKSTSMYGSLTSDMYERFRAKGGKLFLAVLPRTLSVRTAVGQMEDLSFTMLELFGGDTIHDAFAAVYDKLRRLPNPRTKSVSIIELGEFMAKNAELRVPADVKWLTFSYNHIGAAANLSKAYIDGRTNANYVYQRSTETLSLECFNIINDEIYNEAQRH